VFENRMLRRIYGPKREEVEGSMRSFISLSVIRAIKSRRMRWAGHVACMREGREMHTRLWSENLKGRDHLEDLGVDGKIILEWK
jgi:hypothetical protein